MESESASNEKLRVLALFIARTDGFKQVYHNNGTFVNCFLMPIAVQTLVIVVFATGSLDFLWSCHHMSLNVSFCEGSSDLLVVEKDQ